MRAGTSSRNRERVSPECCWFGPLLKGRCASICSHSIVIGDSQFGSVVQLACPGWNDRQPCGGQVVVGRLDEVSTVLTLTSTERPTMTPTVLHPLVLVPVLCHLVYYPLVLQSHPSTAVIYRLATRQTYYDADYYEPTICISYIAIY